MLEVAAEKLCEAMGGKLIRGQANTKIKGIMSRCVDVVPGLLYFDVKGGKGGDLNILEAVKNGAAGIVISKHKKKLPFDDDKIVVIAVAKVWEAFWQSVKFYRSQWDIPVVGVTGTSGKTTTKEMITSIFRRRWKVLKTIGNLNLPCFVPSQIMRLNKGYQAAVFEVGMNRRGQISKQSKAIQPTVGVITHIGSGHVEHLGSFENVIKEKSGIIEGIQDSGYLVLNLDDPSTAQIDLAEFKGKIVYYALKNQADINATDITYEEKGMSFSVNINNQNHRFFIPAFGYHNVYNALAAIAVAQIFDFDVETIKKGLRRYRKPYMRLQVIKGLRDSILLNDTYNANPESVIAGLEVLSCLSQKKTSVAVLGNMLEQGPNAVENHRKVGRKAAELNIDWLVTVGSLAKQIAKGAAVTSKDMKIWSFHLKNQAVAFLKNNLPSKSVVLIKGSRGAYMENLVWQLKQPKETKSPGN